MTAPYQMLPALSDDELTELRTSIEAHGVMVPVLVDEDGIVIDGHHRQLIADTLGIEYPVEMRKDLSETEKRSLALDLNLHRRHLNREQKREVIAASLQADPQLSNRQHADRVGASHVTVGSVRDDLESTGQLDQSDERVSADGRVRPSTQPTPASTTSGSSLLDETSDTGNGRSSAPVAPDRDQSVEDGVDAPGSTADGDPGASGGTGEFEAIIDELEDHHGRPPTAGEYLDAVEENAASKQDPEPSRAPSKVDLDGEGLSHPARYSDGMTARFARILDDLGFTPTVTGPSVQVLDPFAGTGRIHDLQTYGYSTLGVELEPEWAGLHRDTIVGNALNLPHADAAFDAIVTSPTYGNRLADHHNAADPDRRRSYTHDLGRPLTPGNSGGIAWGDEYRALHRAAWVEAHRVLKPGGAFLLNIKDHIKGGRRVEVSAWHLTTCIINIGFALRWVEWIPTRSLRVGTNSGARIDGEYVFVLERQADR